MSPADEGAARIEVDTSTCQGYANCVVEAPDVFDLDEVSNKVVLLVDPVPDRLADAARRAADSCPVRAITVHV